MTRMERLRRQREAAQTSLATALKRHRGGVADARAGLNTATAALLRAEINNRIAAPLLRAQARRDATADLFSHIGS